jgi:hypothetical protein
MEDDGRPIGIGCQEQVSIHFKLLLLRARVVSVEEKAENTRQVWIRKSNINEPSVKRR